MVFCWNANILFSTLFAVANVNWIGDFDWYDIREFCRMTYGGDRTRTKEKFTLSHQKALKSNREIKTEKKKGSWNRKLHIKTKSHYAFMYSFINANDSILKTWTSPKIKKHVCVKLPTQKREKTENDRLGYYFKEQEHSYEAVGVTDRPGSPLSQSQRSN